MGDEDLAQNSQPLSGLETFQDSDLFKVLLNRRSRRFSRGMEIRGGPTRYESAYQPQPLTEEEQAVLVFAACGITGPALADWSYEPDSGGSFLQFVGRTASSPDAAHPMAMFVMDDEGFYDRYYRSESLSDAHRQHGERWHPDRGHAE